VSWVLLTKFSEALRRDRGFLERLFDVPVLSGGQYAPVIRTEKIALFQGAGGISGAKKIGFSHGLGPKLTSVR